MVTPRFRLLSEDDHNVMHRISEKFNFELFFCGVWGRNSVSGFRTREEVFAQHHCSPGQSGPLWLKTPLMFAGIYIQHDSMALFWDLYLPHPGVVTTEMTLSQKRQGGGGLQRKQKDGILKGILKSTFAFKPPVLGSILSNREFSLTNKHPTKI